MNETYMDRVIKSDQCNRLLIKVLENGKGLPLPAYQTSGSAGIDLLSAMDSTIVIHPGTRQMIKCGISVQFSEYLVMQIASRSGLAAKHGVIALISPGIIDSDYRGEICVILYNSGAEPFKVQRGDRIAQAYFTPVRRMRIIESDFLLSSERGENGFGSTGIK